MNKQSGNIVTFLVFGIVVVGVAVAVIWRYNEANKSLDSSESASTAQSAPSKGFTADKTQLPKGWSVQSKDANAVIVGNGGMGVTATNICSVQIVKQADTNAKLSAGSAYEDTLYNQYVTTIHDNKGYTTANLGVVALKVKVNDQVKTVSATTVKLTPPGEGDVMYQRLGFIVRDGVHYDVTQSCTQNDFTEADKALSTLSIQL